MKYPMKSSFGFTLMEMLVALVMAGAVMAPLYIITRGVAEQTSAKQMEIEAMQRTRIAMDALIRDFSRAGLLTSPNTAVDERYLNSDQAGSTAQYRPAVMHLNPGKSGPDAVLLSGNFLGSDVYRAYATGQFELTFIDPVNKREDCERQFNPVFAFAHISDNSGRDLDAGISAVEYTESTQGCQITVKSTDYNTQSYKMGDTVLVSANQTIVYAVENSTLVRYFAAYVSPVSPNSGVCNLSASVRSAADIHIPGTVSADTRQVIANFVEDFQVWFRPVTDNGSGWLEPHYQFIDSVIGENEGNFADGFTPPVTTDVIPLAANGTVPEGSVTCAALQDPKLIGPERVRSALIRLTVRTEKSEASLRRLPDDEASRLEKHTLAADTGTPTASGEDPYAFQLRTVTTEVDMPNLAARSDLL